MRVLALHIRDTLNAGDRWSCPLDYFDIGAREVIFGDMRHPPECSPDLVIYGGGSITASPDFKRWPCPTVAWGVGHNERHDRRWTAVQQEHVRAAGLCDLYFPRDRVDGFDWTPCASCMHPVFDEAFDESQHEEVVRYSAARRIKVEGDGPHMTNEDGSIEDAVRFLASGKAVVTSSYHGAYWAHLLGRPVGMIEWGSKFRYVPTIGLAACRKANELAFTQVLALMKAING
jgi:hypothetical protein